jgi:hypothetical protein
MVCCTRSRVLAVTCASPLTTRETVLGLTPATQATSRSVTGLGTEHSSGHRRWTAAEDGGGRGERTRRLLLGLDPAWRVTDLVRVNDVKARRTDPCQGLPGR